MGESMLMGLRLVTEGVPHEWFRGRHGLHPCDAFGTELSELGDLGLVTVDAVRTTLTPRGLLIGNQVFERFVT
jgi:oxygen-independent coproporphyrinogen-3 oxidase